MEEQENEIIESESSMSFKDIYRLCLANWKWFAISVACCLFLGVIYLLRTAPVYTRTASVLIKDDNNNGRGISSDMNIFSDLGLFSSQSNVNNELSTIKSPEIVLETVRRLHLDMNYFEGGTFYDKALYGKDLPVRVTIVGLSDADDCGFELKVDADGEVTLGDCKYNGESTAKSDYKGYLNKFIATPFGRVLVQRNDKSSEPVKLKVYRGAMVATMQAYRDRLDAMLEDKKATIIDLTYQDVSTQRAEDFLNTLISADAVSETVLLPQGFINQTIVPAEIHTDAVHLCGFVFGVFIVIAGDIITESFSDQDCRRRFIFQILV